MGCNASKTIEAASVFDDSIHRMIVHEQKNCQRHGKSSEIHYVPRKEHPMFKTSGNHTEVTAEEVPDDIVYTKDETNQLLYHAEHHDDTIDPRDKELLAGSRLRVYG